MNSAYFFKFLDSADKEPVTVTTSGRVRYNWVTKINDDEASPCWSLVDGRSHEHEMGSDKKWKAMELSAFGHLLSAFYGLPYIITSALQPKQMTDLAGYYCCLPALSKSLANVLQSDRRHAIWIECDPHIVLDCAYSLRHAELFRECLVLLAGRWHSEYDSALSSVPRGLRLYVRLAHGGICEKIAAINQKGHAERWEGKLSTPSFGKVIADTSYKRCMVNFYRTLGEQKCSNKPEYGDPVYTRDYVPALRALLKSNLRFSDENTNRRSFLCADIDDEDLPWDRDQLDW